jgi:hypothetical protein
MSALQQWWREIDAGKRTASAPWDALHAAACREIADAEFEREVTIPQRIALAELEAQRGKQEPESITEGMHALERWRRLVLESDRRRSPLDVAAAWELTAVECERRGLTDAAEEARTMARAQLKRSIA